MTHSAKLPLRGLKVVDVSQGIAGPYCGQILQQQGADVIKVEPPRGDWGRATGLYRNGFSAASISCNAGKRGICVDASLAEGRAVLARLTAGADVVIENFRPGVAARMGIGYEAVQAANPGVIYVSISGFGASGPYADQPAVDPVLQAMTGMMAVNRGDDGKPRRMGIVMVDVSSGLYAAQAVSSALYRRATDGTGAFIDITLMQASAAFQGYHIVEDEMRAGRERANAAAPSGVFQTADSWLYVGALNDTMFRNLCNVIERPDWLADARFATPADRLAHTKELNDALGQSLAEKPTSYWVAALVEHDVLCSEVLDYEGFTRHPQAVHSSVFARTNQPGIGELSIPRLPNSSAFETVAPAPRIGEHTALVLAEYGYREDEVEALYRCKAAIQG